MSYAIIPPFVISVADRYSAGDPAPDALRILWLTRYFDRLEYHRKKYSLEFDKDYLTYAAQLQRSLILDAPADSSIESEALTIASERITAELAKANLPPPSSIAIHAAELAQSEAIRTEAARRVEARLRASLNLS